MLDSESPDPLVEYTQRLSQRKQSLTAAKRTDRTVSNVRLGVFLAGLGLAVAVIAGDTISAVWLLLPAVVFAVLVVWHDRVTRRLERAEQAVAFYQRGLDRINDSWAGSGVQRDDFVTADHPYAADLDLFGEASLFELLCTARTAAGEQTLARWLAQSAPLETVRSRQLAVEELRHRLDLREDLALLGGGVRAEVKPETLISWAEAPPRFSLARARTWRLVAAVVGPLAVAALFFALHEVFAVRPLCESRAVGPLLLLGALAVVGAIHRLTAHAVHAVSGPVHQALRDLHVLGGLLTRLERESFDAPLLAQQRRDLTADGRPASQAIGRLDRLVTWLDAQQNAMFAPIGLVGLWGLHFALSIDAWRRHAGPCIPAWLAAVGRLEALSSLAGYAHEHPDDTFPELSTAGPCLAAEGLGHPLLPAADCVRNDLTFDPPTRVFIVSGSNMSGKSTLLRSLGLAVVMARAGAPVRARRLTLSSLELGASIRINDSLQQGASRFYAEIQRLSQVMDLSRSDSPLLFLLDEVLHGTNSHDRLQGATALIRQFIARGAIGLVTTHDLALAETTEELGDRVSNVHFCDTIVDKKLVFDYQLRPGVVQRSNAIELMRSVGLDV